MMKSYFVSLSPARDMTHPFIRHILSLHPIAAKRSHTPDLLHCIASMVSFCFWWLLLVCLCLMHKLQFFIDVNRHTVHDQSSYYAVSGIHWESWNLAPIGKADYCHDHHKNVVGTQWFTSHSFCLSKPNKSVQTGPEASWSLPSPWK